MQYLLGLILALAGAGVLLFSTPQTAELNSSNPLYEEFFIWKTAHGKTYSQHIETQRFSIWLENWQFAQEFNTKQTGNQRVGMNLFADLTNQEYQEKYLMKVKPSQNNNNKFYTNQNFVRDQDDWDQINWVENGAVFPLAQNQGQYGNSWYYTVTEALGGIYQIKTGDLIDLSVQQLYDCAPEEQGMATFQYTQEYGIESAANYGFVKGEKQDCKYDPQKIVFKNSGAEKSTPKKIQSVIIENLKKQPLATYVDASSQAFQLYIGGAIMPGTCGTDLNHSVLLVGYHNYGAQPSYCFKNSWGTSWGMDYGFGYVALDGDGDGVCGIQKDVSYPTFDD